MKEDVKKYFIAVVPPEPVLSQVKQMKEDVFQFVNSKGALRSPGHITLHMPFEWSEKKEHILIDKISEYKFDQPAVKISTQGFDVFEPRVVFVQIEENKVLNRLENELSIHMAKALNIFNQRDSLRAFHPHITIAFRDLNKQKFYTVWQKYKAEKYNVEFSVDSFFLLKNDGVNWQLHHEFNFASNKKPLA